MPILVKRKIYNIANNSQIYVSSLYMIKLPKPVKFYHKFKSTFSTCFFSFSFSLFVSTSSFFFLLNLHMFFCFFCCSFFHTTQKVRIVPPSLVLRVGNKQFLIYNLMPLVQQVSVVSFKKNCVDLRPHSPLSLSLSHDHF